MRPSTSGPVLGSLFPQPTGRAPAPPSFVSPNFVPPDFGLPASGSEVPVTPGSGLVGIDGRGSGGGTTPAQLEGGDSSRRHRVSFKYKGPIPLSSDPEACLKLVRGIPEMVDGVPERELRDPAIVSGDLAAGHVWLMSLQGRLERAHKAEVDALKGQLGERIWELGASEEAKRKLAEELALERERARAREEELSEHARQVEELKLKAENFRKDYVASDTEVARLTAQLDIRTRERDESNSKVGRMNGQCRRQVGRMLKEQRGEFKKVCKKQSRRAARVVRDYLEARRPWNRVDKLLSQAEEAERILLRLRSEGVPIPDEKLALIVLAKEKYSVERAQIEEKTLSAQDFEFSLPSDLGVPNLDQVDFSAGFAFGDEEEGFWGGSGDDESEGDEEEGEGEEDSEEEEEEEEEEEDVPLAAKGATSGARSDVEGVPPVGEEEGLGRETEAGGVTHATREETGEMQPAAEGATVPPSTAGVVSEVRSGSDAQLEGEKTPLATAGETPGISEGGGLDRVQLEGDVTPPVREE